MIAVMSLTLLYILLEAGGGCIYYACGISRWSLSLGLGARKDVKFSHYKCFILYRHRDLSSRWTETKLQCYWMLKNREFLIGHMLIVSHIVLENWLNILVSFPHWRALNEIRKLCMGSLCLFMLIACLILMLTSHSFCRWGTAGVLFLSAYLRWHVLAENFKRWKDHRDWGLICTHHFHDCILPHPATQFPTLNNIIWIDKPYFK